MAPPPGGGGAAGAADAFARDAQSGIMALTLSEAGVAIDVGAQFREGTQAASLMSATTNSGALLARLPAQSFYLAGAFDFSAGGVRDLLDSLNLGADEGGMPSLINAQLFAKEAQGMAFSVGQSPGGVMGGTLLSNTIGFMACKDSAAMLGAIRADQKARSGKSMGPVKVTTEYEQDQPLRDMPDQKVDVWTSTIEFDQNDPKAAESEFAMGMLLGGNRLSYMASAVDGGVLMTMSKNSRLMRSAVNAGRTGSGQTSDETMRVLQANLPAKRSFELYLGVKPVLETIRETMMLEESDMPVPDSVPPIGLAGTTDGGAFTLRLFAPAQALPAIANAVKAMNPGGPGGGDEPQPEPKRTGKPQF
jgi:hypothetical protein